MFQKLKQKLKSSKLIQKILSLFTIFVILGSIFVVPSSAYSDDDYQALTFTTQGISGSSEMYFIGNPNFSVFGNSALPSDYSVSSTIFTYSFQGQEVPCVKLVFRNWYKYISFNGTFYEGHQNSSLAIDNPKPIYSPDHSYEFVGSTMSEGTNFYHCFVIPIVTISESETVYSVWTHVTESIFSLISSVQVVFFDASLGKLTLLGALSVLGVGLMVIFLFIGVISNFLKNRG